MIAFSTSIKNFAFLTHFMKNYFTVEMSTKTKIMCDTGSINIRILSNEAHPFTDFTILRHNNLILDI